MIVLASIRLGKDRGEGHPEIADISGIPTLFGVCVYSFMCHHSLPSLATPIRDKSKIFGLFAADYTLIMMFYSVLSFTAIYAFKELKDLYTLNFLPSGCNNDNPITTIPFIQYFLALFPVFTLSTNFPIIGITLRNNLKTLCLTDGRTYSFFVDRICFPILGHIDSTNNCGFYHQPYRISGGNYGFICWSWYSVFCARGFGLLLKKNCVGSFGF